jgi:hypothetical protein
VDNGGVAVLRTGAEIMLLSNAFAVVFFFLNGDDFAGDDEED